MNFTTNVRKLAAATAALATAVTLTACATGNVESGNPDIQSAEATTTQVAEPVAPKVSIPDGAADVSPVDIVTVSSDGGPLEDVTVTNEEGYEVAGELGEDGLSWGTTEDLGFSRSYTVHATEKNGGETTTSFTTVTPAATNTVAMSPIEESTVGVGQVIEINFAAPVEDKEAAEAAVHIETEPSVEGAFYWQDDSLLRWRPKEFWEPGTTVNVHADIYGHHLGGGVYGAEDVSTNFTVGDRVVTHVDDATKTMRVYKNGEMLREIPVSLGRDGGEWATPNGIYRVGDMNESMIMDSTTYGLGLDEGGYQTPVNYATQMSWSGIYVHGAPWSEWAQGNTNTSHGCINVTDEAAAWFQSVVKRGDPIIVMNSTGGTLTPMDGLGDWNYAWEDIA